MANNKYFYRPLKHFFIHQAFGENKACVDLATGTKVITCDGNNPPKGYKSLYGKGGHKGIDLGANHGQNVYVSCDGVVDSVDANPKTGLDVKIVSEIGGKRYRHIYEHLLGYQFQVGQKVQTGDLVGWADNTGWSSGDHLHFQIEEWNGKKWIPVDPMELLDTRFALDIKNILGRLKELTAIVAEYIAEQMRKKNG